MILQTLILLLCSYSIGHASYTFDVFNNENEAALYLIEQSKLHNAPTPNIIKPSFKDARRVKVITDTVLTHFRLLHSENNNIPNSSPFILLVEMGRVNGYVLNDNSDGHTPYLFVLAEEALQLSDDALTGFIAHELVHLILQWTDSFEVFHPHQYFYHKSVPPTLGTSHIPSLLIDTNIRKFISRYGEDNILNFPEADQVRFYNREDHADEIATTVLHSMRISPQAYNSFLISTFFTPNITCNTQNEPEYGDLGDPHHSACWRAWRNESLYHKLNRNSR